MEKCLVQFCRNERDLLYLGKGICDKHWNQYAENRQLLRDKLNVKKKEITR